MAIPMKPAASLDVLPESAFYGQDGLLYWRVTRGTEGGEPRESVRRLARTLDEARNERIDFVHPTLGVIWEGWKLADDRPAQDRMNDRSTGGAIPRGAYVPDNFAAAVPATMPDAGQEDS